MQTSLRTKFTTLLPALLLVAGLLFHAPPPLHATATDDENIELLDRTAKAFSSVVKKTEDAVVHVRVEKTMKEGSQSFHGENPFEFFNDPFFERFFGPQFQPPRQMPRQMPKEAAAGSGFFISKDGYILTNNHVVDDSDDITIRLSDKREYKAKVIGTDPQSDVALLKIDGDDFPYLTLGDSDKIQVGEWVIAIGNPFELSRTVTVGVVSAKGRSRIGINDYENFIQTDAAINPGNSGGPLLNIHGQVIGMNTAIFSRSGGYMGIGFAIPVNMIKAVEQQLKEKGKVTRGWLGVVIQDINKDLAKSFHLSTTNGVLVSEVQKGSPAEKDGMKQGDVIISLDGRAVVDVPDLRNHVAMTAPGHEAKLVVIRDGKEKTLTVTIGEQPSNFHSLASTNKPEDTTLEHMGLILQDLTADLAQQFGYQPGQGVLIAEVAPNSIAAEAGLQAGQLIEEVDKQRVHNLKELQNVIGKSKNANQVLLRVRAGDYSRYVVLSTQ